MCLVLIIGLAFGYGAGVATMVHIRGHEGDKQTAESPKSIAAKERLAVLRRILTDKTIVQAQFQELGPLEAQQAKALNDRSTWIDGPPASPRSGKGF